MNGYGMDGLEIEKRVIRKRIAFCPAAVENTRPVMLLEKVKVGSVIYMVPTPITEHR